jgi:hypothetical protein
MPTDLPQRPQPSQVWMRLQQYWWRFRLVLFYSKCRLRGIDIDKL